MDIAATTAPVLDPRAPDRIERPAESTGAVKLRVLRGVDSRPPARTWAGSVLSPRSLQPSLLTLEAEPMMPSDPVRGAPLLVSHAWTSTPSRHLPDAATWSGQMARVLVETLHGQRPVGQLTRWVDERVLASVTVLLRGRARTRRSAPGRGPGQGQGLTRPEVGQRPPVLQSVRVQCPSPDVLEVAVHVRVGHRSEAVAFRLQGWYDRWLCTALEIGPRHSRGVEDA